jgi:hypothetical protein
MSVAYFTGELAEHERALRQLVPHPDRLRVERRRHSFAELDAIRNEVEPLVLDYAGRHEIFSRIGLGPDYVGVVLERDPDRLAEQLRRRYGDAIRVTIGGPKTRLA